MEEHTNYLVHHGVKGQRWGIRRYQNPDGSLTAEGKRKLNTYKVKQNENLTKYSEKKNAKFKKKLSKNLSEEKRKKIVNKYYAELAAQAIERSAIKNLTLSGMNAEKTAVGRDRVARILLGVGGFVTFGRQKVSFGNGTTYSQYRGPLPNKRKTLRMQRIIMRSYKDKKIKAPDSIV